MKTVSELLELINQAITTNGSKYDQWFINFSGHVNKISISYYQAGWEMSKEMGGNADRIDIILNEEGSIQEGYWFIQNRLG